MKASSSLHGHAALLAASLIYGLNYFTLKSVLNEGIAPLGLLAFRCICASLVFIAVHKLFIREKIKDKRDFGLLALCAIFGIIINQTFYITGLKHTVIVNAAVLMVPTPVFVFLAAWLLGTEKMNWRKVGGLAISFCGALALILTNTGGGFSLSPETLTGDLMIMINAASYGVYLALVRPLLLKYHTITITMWVFVMGSVVNVLIGLRDFLALQPSALSAGAWWGIAYLIIFSTIGAYFLNAIGMKKLNASAAGIYIYVQPVFVTLAGIWLSNAGLTPVKVLCMLVIFAGVYLVTWTPRRQVHPQL